MAQEKTGKLKDIRESVSGAVQLVQYLRDPKAQESFGKIMDAAMVAKEIVKDLQTPEMVKNIENFRMISENMNQASAKMQDTIKKLDETGVISETKGFVKSARGAMDSFGQNGGDLQQMGVVIKEMLVSMRDLIDELKLTIIDYKNSATNHNIKETVKDASEIYRTAIYKESWK